MDAAGDADRAGRHRRLPIDPYEAAVIDGANGWQMFRYITLPLVWPFIVVAAVMRIIDALKAFDTIFVITNGGPGTSSETINMLLYQTAFGYYDLGYASAMVVVFFVRSCCSACCCACGNGAACAAAQRTGALAPRARTTALVARFRAQRRPADSSRAGPDLAGDPVLLLDAVAVAEERGRTTRPIRRCSSRTRRRWPTSSTCSPRTTSSPTRINSVIVSFTATGLALLLGVPAGYGIAKTKATKSAVLILVARVTPACPTSSRCS